MTAQDCRKQAYRILRDAACSSRDISEAVRLLERADSIDKQEAELRRAESIELRRWLEPELGACHGCEVSS